VFRGLRGNITVLCTPCYVLLLPIFWFPQNQKKWKWKNTKKYIKKIFERNPKLIGVRKGCWNAEKW
jgi:hypothetical protein